MSESKGEFWSGRRKKFWTIGVILMLLTAGGVAAAYLIVVKKESANLPRPAAKGELSAYLSDEFKAANREGTRLEKKFPVTDPAQFAESMQSWVGPKVTWEEFFPGGGVKMLGAGAAAVPGPEPAKSAHIQLAPEPDKTNLGMSIFIQRYTGFPALDDREAYSLPGRNLGQGAPPITVWRRGGLICYLVSNSKDGIEVLRQALGAPEPKKAY